MSPGGRLGDRRGVSRRQRIDFRAGMAGRSGSSSAFKVAGRTGLSAVAGSVFQLFEHHVVQERCSLCFQRHRPVGCGDDIGVFVSRERVSRAFLAFTTTLVWSRFTIVFRIASSFANPLASAGLVFVGVFGERGADVSRGDRFELEHLTRGGRDARNNHQRK